MLKQSRTFWLISYYIAANPVGEGLVQVMVNALTTLQQGFQCYALAGGLTGSHPTSEWSKGGIQVGIQSCKSSMHCCHTLLSC